MCHHSRHALPPSPTASASLIFSHIQMEKNQEKSLPKEPVTLLSSGMLSSGLRLMLIAPLALVLSEV